ncbi:hypothetical protein [Streptacidiphilus sp. EB103A]|uniref:hypothetical protein n=1 Tax=Streptacidiphilus sp. EB103A TaxID=3156275 RepID=UPI0035177321
MAYDDEQTSYQVDTRALALDSGETFRELRAGRLLRTAGDLPGIPAGYFSVGHHQPEPDGCCRPLEQADPATVDALLASGETIPTATVAPAWTEPRPRMLRGLRLGELRALLAATDLPDDALVVLAPSGHPEDSTPLGSLHPILYSPDTTCAGNFGGYYDLNELDRAPANAAVALQLWAES